MTSQNNRGRESDSEAGAGTYEPSKYWEDDFLPLQEAGKAILQVLRKDEASPHGDLYRRILSTASATTTTPSSYGDNVPNHHYFPDGSWTHSQSIPLPPFLQEQLPKAKMSTLMGLFAEAQMAWMTIDDSIYLWSYNSFASIQGAATEAEFLCFQVPTHQPIVSAGLARPKAGVFQEFVEWCLVVTTKEEAMLCALARKKHQGLKAVPTKFVIPSDWISFLSVTTTKSGRIFLGGQDGNLYELDYDYIIRAHSNEGLLPDAKSRLDEFYDGETAVCPAQLSEDTAASKSILAQGKRILEGSHNPLRGPPRKCRKVNHTQSAITSLVPDVLAKLTSAVFGDSTTTGGGPIIHMAVDEERQVLYTLSTRGWICALDIAEAPKITLAAVLNTTSTARLYLEAVSRGRMYAPSTGSAREGHLAFPGGGEAAQAGVGGMEGARHILKLAERSKSNGRQKPSSPLLTPVAIEVVPMRESTRITLVAITSGGMRYYLSSLNPNSLGAGPTPQKFGTPSQSRSTKPYSRMTLCHIRAPPSLVENDMSAPSQTPSQMHEQRVDAACYRLGVFFVAFNKAPQNPQNEQSSLGNILVAASADSSARILHGNKKENEGGTLTYVTPGGICESVSYPLASRGGDLLATAVLPGGRVWDICSATGAESKMLSLVLRSKTPSDTELGFGVAPAYVPPSKRVGLSDSSSSLTPHTSTAAISKPSVHSLAITLMANWLLSRPARYGIDVEQTILQGSLTPAMYRISNRSGAIGFSLSAADSRPNAGTASTRSARLSPWLLTPQVVPLNPMALQYLEFRPSTFVALNAGGLHTLRRPSVLEQLSSAILTAGANARSDPAVSKFFDAYGYPEGCGMCLLLTITPASSNELKDFAMRAALSRAYRPAVAPSQQGNEHHNFNDPWLPTGYFFTSSALYDGLTLAVTRLLRPIWHKPAVVVTEGRILRKGTKTAMTPAKVELLLEDDVLEEIRSPLIAMQRLIGRVFSKAVDRVPQSKPDAASPDQMEIDEDPHYLTRVLEYQRRGQFHSDPTIMRASEADELAQHIEERNIHSLFRLISRTTQLLSLFSRLRTAHFMPDLPEVDWGQLHGISFAQLIQTREGQDRLEGVLNSLVTSTSEIKTRSTASADAKELAEQLSQQCFHFFSPGSRFAYFGFQAARDALAAPAEQQSRRRALASEAVENLKNASMYWHSPHLVAGRLLQSQDFESYDKMAERALQSDSPVAKSCALLVELKDVAALVEICLRTASNFGPRTTSVSATSAWRKSFDTYPWESGLYHKRQSLPSASHSSPTSTAGSGSITANDAVDTCHALIFHHLKQLLDSPLATEMYGLGEKMVSVCAASKDTDFLEKFYAHLLKQHHTDVLLRINSPTLEAWLSKEKENLELLLRFYQIQEKNIEAGSVAWNYATGAHSDLDLNGRTEYLVYAVDSFRRAISSGQKDLNEAKLNLMQAEERLSIARLQGRILQRISSTKYELSAEDIKPLQVKLLGANELLNRFAMPYDLYEYCLLLLHACNHSDIVHIQQFWKSLICEEIFPCSTRSEQAYSLLRGFAEGSLLEDPVIKLLDEHEHAATALFEDGFWMKGVQEVVARLGSEILGNNENIAFPVDFVTCCLEEIRRAYAVTAKEFDARKSLVWSYSILVSAGVDHLAALRAYEKMAERENYSMMGVDPRRRLEQIQAVIAMLESFESAARLGDTQMSTRAREEMSEAQASGMLLAIIEEYSSKLQSLPMDISAEESRLRALEAAQMRK